MSPRATNYPDGTLWTAARVDEVRNDYARRLQVPATYTIWEQGGNYYADHCLETGTDYSGANASTVIQAAIDALTSGGKIFFKDGTYPISTALANTVGGLWLCGEGESTILQSNTSNIFESKVAAGYPHGVQIRGIKFDANGNDVNCIVTDRFQDGLIESCFFTGTTTSKYLVVLDDFDQWTIRDCQFRTFKFGIKLDNSGTGGYAESGTSVIKENTFLMWHDNAVGIFFADSTPKVNDMVIRNNLFGSDVETGEIGIDGQYGEVVEVHGNWFEMLAIGCRLYSRWWVHHNDFSAGNGEYGIKMTGGGGWHNIGPNQWSLTGTGKAIDVDFWNGAGRWCKITEPTLAIGDLTFGAAADQTESILELGVTYTNRGLTGAIATGTAVAHGLVTNPTNIIITAAEAGPTDIYVDTVGAVNFNINFGGGGNKTFYWVAKYVP